ncbi:MAG: hypothetical protein H8K06_20415 [Nitrospira sp.]|uniref:Uncharacterized protein n=1 Tax=Nitrospira defluvii TaxID=330214 RepID=A0ABM8RG30_9BACT|nr:hypothetical protein [Nitrospira defluvii]MCS6329421.1 hypothetical protein [Nitrospira sp.]CAE6750911.1 conserved exported hypothetical protein [Nitrospira defluvii]
MKQSRRIFGMLVLVGLLSAAISSFCSAGLFDKDETVGERFRKAIKKIKQSCESRKLVPGEVCGEVAKLKPTDPLATEEGRFAHSIKIPNPLPEDSGYRPGMTSEQYFDHLCKTEAGEFIYKTVDNVEGIFMMRPRKEATDWELEHLYALEDPYGYVTEGSAETGRELLVRSGAYVFLEERSLVVTDGTVYRRYTAKYKGNKKILVGEDTAVLGSRYGYVWRGIVRPHDRELGIAGGELVVLDTQSNEVVAVRRGFLRSGDVRNRLTGVWWPGAYTCPRGRPGRTDFYTYDLLGEVLLPARFNVEMKGHQNVAK